MTRTLISIVNLSSFLKMRNFYLIFPLIKFSLITWTIFFITLPSLSQVNIECKKYRERKKSLLPSPAFIMHVKFSIGYSEGLLSPKSLSLGSWSMQRQISPTSIGLPIILSTLKRPANISWLSFRPRSKFRSRFGLVYILESDECRGANHQTLSCHQRPAPQQEHSGLLARLSCQPRPLYHTFVSLICTLSFPHFLYPTHHA